MAHNLDADEVHGPFENPFKKFSNMTYSISIYLQSPDHYTKMMNSTSGYKSVDGLSLILQSGGISNNSTFGATRSKFFTQDFYIDNTQFKSLISGTSVGAPHNTFELNFTVTEPMGLTFLENLNAAIQDYNVNELGISTDEINFISQTYLMVVRFYGYDKNGRMVRHQENDTTPTSDINAASEKFIPFMFTGITFRLESDKVVYSCKAVCPQTQIATDKLHGTVPKNMNLQGSTLSELYNGPKGLVETLNAHQQKLVSDKKILIADEYAVEFQAGSDLAGALLAQPGTPLHARTGWNVASVNKASNDLLNRTKVEKGIRTYATNAGMQIGNFLDLSIRSSSFITNQYLQHHDANKDNTSKPNSRTDEKLIWFKITHRIKVLAYDKIRGTFAYRITFVISEYPINSIDGSPFITNKECFDVHKEYDFWFTGVNTEVLDFSQDYNFLYYTSFGSRKINNQPGVNSRLMHYQVNSREANSEKGEGEEAANAASILYSPADQANAKIVIVGDPDWIAQSELFYPAQPDSIKSITMPDGSINYDTAEIFFSVNFNTVVDYNLQTGLADVTARNVGTDNPLAGPGGVSQYSLVYRANTITTQLASGKFTQELEGTIKFVPDSCVVKATTEGRKEKDKTTVAVATNGRII